VEDGIPSWRFLAEACIKMVGDGAGCNRHAQRRENGSMDRCVFVSVAFCSHLSNSILRSLFLHTPRTAPISPHDSV
jgi:hypothetical protein